MKLCPLKFNANQEVVKEDYLCEESECAWWDTDTEECVVHNLGAIAEVLWNG